MLNTYIKQYMDILQLYTPEENTVHSYWQYQLLIVEWKWQRT